MQLCTGQYDGKSKPLPEYHVKIAGFDEKVTVLLRYIVPLPGLEAVACAVCVNKKLAQRML